MDFFMAIQIARGCVAFGAVHVITIKSFNQIHINNFI